MSKNKLGIEDAFYANIKDCKRDGIWSYKRVRILDKKTFPDTGFALSTVYYSVQPIEKLDEYGYPYPVKINGKIYDSVYNTMIGRNDIWFHNNIYDTPINYDHELLKPQKVIKS